jgi:uncharacterized protein YdeI (YjbR/CyaY-like superfamily)
MGAFDDAPLVEVETAAEWRAWLEAHHASARGVWLVVGRTGSGGTGPSYEVAVEEALCFGWVDSKGGAIDEQRSKLYFAPRRPRSAWAGTNKARVERLMAAGRMAPAGLAAIEAAKENGSWTILDSVERLEVPDDLAAALSARPGAREHWDAFPRSVRRSALESVAFARRSETRASRIEQIAVLAERNERPVR